MERRGGYRVNSGRKEVRIALLRTDDEATLDKSDVLECLMV